MANGVEMVLRRCQRLQCLADMSHDVSHTESKIPSLPRGVRVRACVELRLVTSRGMSLEAGALRDSDYYVFVLR